MIEPKKRGRPPKPVVLIPNDPPLIIKVDDVPDMDVGADEAPRQLSPSQVKALDHDFNGQAGGSRPIASLGDRQREAYVLDAMAAYEGQENIRRGDGFNRIWSFRHEVVDNKDHMLIRCDRGPIYSERLISTVWFTAEVAEAAIIECDEETSR